MRSQPNSKQAMASGPLTHELILVGGGHTHALFIKRLLLEPIPGLRCTLISDHIETPYSGMLPGHLSGAYTREAIYIDLARLCHQAGVAFVIGRVSRVDHQSRSVHLEDGDELFFDLLSLDTGSRPAEIKAAGNEFAGATKQVGIKPIDSFLSYIGSLESTLMSKLGSPVSKIAIVGAGPAGCECAVALKLRFGARVEVTLVQRGPRILPSLSWLARQHMLRALKRLEIHLCLGQEATAEFLTQFDHCINATPPRPHAETPHFGLSQDSAGFIKIKRTLQSVDHEHIFVTGDLSSLGEEPFPKAGVYAVRQAPILYANIRLLMSQHPLQEYHPQARYLSLMLAGPGWAILNWGPIGLCGPGLWRWKDKIDRRFMTMVNGDAQDRLGGATDANDHAPMQCFGCAAKVGALALAGGLKSLGRASVGIGADFSQIAVGGSSLLQSVDFFPMFPFADDAWVTRVTLQHAMNDLYVSGSKPQYLQMIAGLPPATAKINERRLQRILTTTSRILSPLGVDIIGGHTALTDQALLGFVVQGERQATLWSKQGAQVGDSLILTKKLGSGVFLVAHRLGLISPRATMSFMTELPQGHDLAANILKNFSIHAITDISGFGLLGHVSDLLSQDLAVRLNLLGLPLYMGIDKLLKSCRSSAYADNYAAFHRRIVNRYDDHEREAILYDPQTAGPLCLIIPKSEALNCQTALAKAGYHASIIGEIVKGVTTARLDPGEILVKGPLD